MSERLFRVTYTGDDVHAIPGVGVFQNGTTTVVTEEVAEKVKAHAKFSVVAVDGGAAPKPAAPAPAAEKPAEKKPEKVEAKKEEKAEAKKEKEEKPEAEGDDKKSEPAAG